MDFPAEWDNIDYPNAIIRTHPNGTPFDITAGLRRNQQMLESRIAFPGGAGTQDMISRARRAGVPVMQYIYIDGQVRLDPGS